MKKGMKKAFTVALSMTMVMGMGANAFATSSNNQASVDAPIYSYDILDVIVPTTYAVAFNPDGLTITTATGKTSTDQIVSKNYGIVNKSTKDKVVTVELTVTDKNDGDDAGKIVFVDTAAEVTAADKDTYAIHLTAVPATDTPKKGDGSTAIDKAATAADLADVSMTKAADDKAVTLKAGENAIGFRLAKATYALKSGESIELGTDTVNNVKEKYEVSALGAEGATAFTFAGTMNDKADWTKITKGINITAVYNYDTAGDEQPIEDAGAMVEVVSSPKFTAGSEVGTINYTVGKGDKALSSITKIEMELNGSLYDGFNSASGKWYAATNENGKITFQNAYLNYYLTALPDDTTVEATVTYVTEAGTTETSTVNVKIR